MLDGWVLLALEPISYPLAAPQTKSLQSWACITIMDRLRQYYFETLFYLILWILFSLVLYFALNSNRTETNLKTCTVLYHPVQVAFCLFSSSSLTFCLCVWADSPCLWVSEVGASSRFPDSWSCHHTWKQSCNYSPARRGWSFHSVRTRSLYCSEVVLFRLNYCLLVL